MQQWYVGVQFSYPIPCDSISPAAFSIIGEGAPNVTTASPLACVGGETQTMRLGVAPAFNPNCPYTVSFRIGLQGPVRFTMVLHVDG